jgi:hypothetical protein
MKIFATTLLAVASCFGAACAIADDRLPEAPVFEINGQDAEYRRQHYLYDADHQPETVGVAETDCSDVRVRTPLADGTTKVTRVNKCGAPSRR